MRVIRTLAALLALLAAGMWLGGHPDRLPEPLRDVFVEERLRTAAEAIEVIEDRYFTEVDQRTLQDRSISGMVDYLRRRYEDRFSHYFDPRAFDRFRESTSGNFSGVGMTVNEHARGLRVVETFPRSPARRAGIERGDVIVAVDGRSIAGERSEAATSRIRGPSGTTVRLTFIDREADRRRTEAVERAEIEVPAVRASLRTVGGRRIAYAELSRFTRGAHGELRGRLRRLSERGARATVLDLRGNPGGLLTEAVLVTSVFLEEGVVVTTRQRGRPRRVLRAEGDALPRRPLVVLVDRDSASASEIVAAALGEHNVATVVGDCPEARALRRCRTFGKGVFQQVVELENGGALDLTVGRFFTPRGRSLAGRGLRADVRVADRERTDRDEALDRALRLVARELR